MKSGVCYYPEHWPEARWAEDARAMVALGLTFVRIGEFAWSRIEPREGQFDWGWLDRAVAVLGEAGLSVMLGTPSATPPRWMVDKYPDMLAYDAGGQPRKFGARRHYCFSHRPYRDAAAKITAALAQRYAGNPHIHSWQIDNEYGCHDTVLSYSPAARAAFVLWLADKYGTIEALNTAWGNVFWSMDYSDFAQVDLPNLTVTEPNPSHVMDFRRFSSDQVVAFNRAQAEAIRAHCDKPLIHNYMGRITEFDHFAVGADLDIATWDSYPLGFLEDRSDRDEPFKHDYQRQGDPDFQAFHHDLYRAVGRGAWGIMEQQPGAVNWAPYNPAPLPGMVRLWSLEALAHGAEFVNYFRWRQAPFAQEQMHAGLLRPDGQRADVTAEVAHMIGDIATLGAVEHTPARVAIVFDYASAWAWDTQPQGQDFDYFRLVFDVYCALRKLGQSVDIIPPSTDDFGARDVVLIPGLFAWTEPLRKALASFEGQVIIGPRTGSKTDDFHIPDTLPPQIASMDITVTSVESLRASGPVAIAGEGAFQIWREFTQTSETVTLRTADGHPAVISKGAQHYLCGWPDSVAMIAIVRRALNAAGRSVEDMADGLRCRDFGRYRLYMNYGPRPNAGLPPAAVRVIERQTKAVIIKQ